MTASSIDDALRQLIAQIVRDELAKQGKPAANDEYLTPKEAAEIAKVIPSTIRRWVAQGRLTRCQAGGDLRVRRAELERMMTSPSPRPAANENRRLTPEALAMRDLARYRAARR